MMEVVKYEGTQSIKVYNCDSSLYDIYLDGNYEIGISVCTLFCNTSCHRSTIIVKDEFSDDNKSNQISHSISLRKTINGIVVTYDIVNFSVSVGKSNAKTLCIRNEKLSLVSNC